MMTGAETPDPSGTCTTELGDEAFGRTVRMFAAHGLTDAQLRTALGLLERAHGDRSDATSGRFARLVEIAIWMVAGTHPFGLEHVRDAMLDDVFELATLGFIMADRGVTDQEFIELAAGRLREIGRWLDGLTCSPCGAWTAEARSFYLLVAGLVSPHPIPSPPVQLARPPSDQGPPGHLVAAGPHATTGPPTPAPVLLSADTAGVRAA